ncbi:MAG: hypothetical protein ACOZQL_08650 [Myxococcota bacterium]
MVAGYVWPASTSRTSPWPWEAAATFEHRCQACGARQLERSVRNGWVSIAVGVLTLPLLMISLPLLVNGTYDLLFRRRAPVVPGVQPPPVRFSSGPPVRQCTCGGSCWVYDVADLGALGHLIRYRCERCERLFNTQTLRGMLNGVWAAAWILPLQVLMALSGEWWSALVVLIGPAFFLWYPVQSALNASRYPARKEW